MITGPLHCPSCGSSGMGGYSYYESDGYGYWIFYNISTITNEWKCWAFFASDGRDVKWYDPCNCCFNPCDVEPVRLNYYDTYLDKEAKENARCATIICRCFFFFMLCYFIYTLYMFFCIWYDICYSFCNVHEMKTIYIGNGREITVPSSLNIWTNRIFQVYTEQFWTTNYFQLFTCTRCGKNYNTFRYFIGNNQTVQIVNNQNVLTNP